jgi:hypothetical protein
MNPMVLSRLEELGKGKNIVIVLFSIVVSKYVTRNMCYQEGHNETIDENVEVLKIPNQSTFTKLFQIGYI